MNLQQIDYVIAVSKYHNFQQAADSCNITQSTLSTMIGKFEDEIGIKIFDRKTKPVTITKEGSEVLTQLKKITQEVDNLKEITQNLKGEISGTINIAVIPTIAPYLLPLFINDFIKKYPSVKFSISELTTSKIIENIKKREIDIAIVSLPLEDKNLIEIPLYDEHFVVYNHQESARTSMDIDELDTEKLWLLEEGHCMRNQIVNICNSNRLKNGIHNNLEYKSGSINTLLKFVNLNKGTTLLPYLSTLDFSREEQNKIVEINGPKLARSIGLVVHPHFIKKKILNSLKEEIMNNIPIDIKKNRDEKIIFSPL